MDLYEPIDIPKPVADDVWIVDGPIVKMDMVVTKMPFPTRMTVVRLQNGELFLHSPTEFNEELSRRIDELGPVAHLVSPNKIHYAHIKTWKDHYPNATAWASPGVRERAASQDIEVRFDRDLGDEAEPQWADDLDQLVFRGSRYMEEIVFFHRKTKTLILTDLIENFEPDRTPKKYRWLLKLAGITDPDGSTPRDFRMTFWGNKAEAHRSAQALIDLNPERVIVAHGRWYETNGTDELRRALRWALT